MKLSLFVAALLPALTLAIPVNDVEYEFTLIDIEFPEINLDLLNGAFAGTSAGESVEQRLRGSQTAKCPSPSPKFCPIGNFCCGSDAVGCCAKECCGEGTNFCGSDGRCYRFDIPA
ncbi:hypothetical protein ACO1O0_003644 [Amphichorda felina]